MKDFCQYCGSLEFMTEPNQYDVLTLEEGKFIVKSTEQIDDYKVFCRECGKEVDLLKINK